MGACGSTESEERGMMSLFQATGTTTLTNLGPCWTLLGSPSGCKDNRHLQWCLKAQGLGNRTGIGGGQRKWWTQTQQYESATGLVLGQKPGQFSSVQFSMKPGTDIYTVCRWQESGQVRAHRQLQGSGLLANSPTAANSPLDMCTAVEVTHRAQAGCVQMLSWSS